jgi:hypothetical protein
LVLIAMAVISLYLLFRADQAREPLAGQGVSDPADVMKADIMAIRELGGRIRNVRQEQELDSLEARIYARLGDQAGSEQEPATLLYANLSRFVALKRQELGLRERRGRILGRLILLDREMERQLAQAFGDEERELAEDWRNAFEEAVITLLKLERVQGRGGIHKARQHFITAFETIQGITLEHPKLISPRLDLSVAELAEYGLGDKDNLIELRYRLLDIADERRILEARHQVLQGELDREWAKIHQQASRDALERAAQADRWGLMLKIWLVLSPLLLWGILAATYMRLLRTCNGSPEEQREKAEDSE